jgi:hypothetical protein
MGLPALMDQAGRMVTADRVWGITMARDTCPPRAVTAALDLAGQAEVEGVEVAATRIAPISALSELETVAVAVAVAEPQAFTPRVAAEAEAPLGFSC